METSRLKMAIGTATPPLRSLAVSPLRRKSRALAGPRSNVPSLMHCDLFVFWQWFTYVWHLVDAVSTNFARSPQITSGLGAHSSLGSFARSLVADHIWAWAGGFICHLSFFSSIEILDLNRFLLDLWI